MIKDKDIENIRLKDKIENQNDVYFKFGTKNTQVLFFF